MAEVTIIPPPPERVERERINFLPFISTPREYAGYAEDRWLRLCERTNDFLNFYGCNPESAVDMFAAFARSDQLIETLEYENDGTVSQRFIGGGMGTDHEEAIYDLINFLQEPGDIMFNPGGLQHYASSILNCMVLDLTAETR